MFTWFSKLFRPQPDKNEERINQLFSFLIHEHGFHFDKINLGDAVNKDGEFVFHGPLIAYRIYNETVCINILFLVQRQDYEIYITDSHKNDQIYIRNGMKVSNELAYDLERFAVEVKNAVTNGGDRMKKTIFDQMPDVEVLFEFNGTRKNPAAEGYRPHHLVTDDYLTTGVHHYYDTPTVPPNGTAKGTITFITPEAYPHCLWVGKRIPIQEGARIVGYATILKIYNPILLLENTP